MSKEECKPIGSGTICINGSCPHWVYDNKTGKAGKCGFVENYEKFQKRIHSLEQKIGNTDVEATLTSDAERIADLENWRLSLEQGPE